jgi:chemotaxis protein histidine kinase CheA
MASDDIGDALEAFNAEYRKSVPDRLREVEGLWAEVQVEANGERLRALLRGLHSMAGSGTTFGMPRLSEAAAAAEDWIQADCEGGRVREDSRGGVCDARGSALRAAASA